MSFASRKIFRSTPPRRCCAPASRSIRRSRHWNAGPGKKVAIVGMGGLGHMGVKLGPAHGRGNHRAQPVACQEGRRLKLGAKEYYATAIRKPSTSSPALRSHHLTPSAPRSTGTPISACSRSTAPWSWSAFPEHPVPVHAFSLIGGRKSLSGSMIGSIKETQEMLDFCGKHNIVSDIEMIDIQQVNEAYERMLKSDVRYRFVIDMASLKAQES